MAAVPEVVGYSYSIANRSALFKDGATDGGAEGTSGIPR
jgi:hypothetical protein